MIFDGHVGSPSIIEKSFLGRFVISSDQTMYALDLSLNWNWHLTRFAFKNFTIAVNGIFEYDLNGIFST